MASLDSVSDGISAQGSTCSSRLGHHNIRGRTIQVESIHPMAGERQMGKDRKVVRAPVKVRFRLGCQSQGKTREKQRHKSWAAEWEHEGCSLG